MIGWIIDAAQTQVATAYYSIQHTMYCLKPVWNANLSALKQPLLSQRPTHVYSLVRIEVLFFQKVETC